MLFILLTAVALAVVFWVIDIMSVSKASTITTAEKQAETEFAVSWLFKIAGGFVATVASLALLVRTLEREPPASLLPFVLPLLGGILLAAPHWAVAIALAVVVIGLTAREVAVSLSTQRGPV
jgi:hypothetical protein